MLGVIHCKVTGNVSAPHLAENRVQVKIYNYFGQQLNAESLCYHLNLLDTGVNV